MYESLVQRSTSVSKIQRSEQVRAVFTLGTGLQRPGWSSFHHKSPCSHSQVKAPDPDRDYSTQVSCRVEREKLYAARKLLRPC